MDAFKVFAKVEPGAYTEEAIAASKASNGISTNGTGSGHHTTGNEKIGTGSGDAGRGVDGKDPKIDAHKKGGKVGVTTCPELALQYLWAVCVQ